MELMESVRIDIALPVCTKVDHVPVFPDLEA